MAVTASDRRVVRCEHGRPLPADRRLRRSRFPNGSRNTGDADLEVLRLAVVELQPDDDVRLCEIYAIRTAGGVQLA